MAFTRRRGRPRKALVSRSDHGTPELQRRHVAGITAESLDLALSRGVITEAQHRAGMHFRWLHSVRFGVCGLRAIDPLHYGGRELMRRDDAWMAMREQEYRLLEHRLSASKALDAVMEAAVHGCCRWAAGGRALDKLREGLDLIESHQAALHRRKPEPAREAASASA